MMSGKPSARMPETHSIRVERPNCYNGALRRHEDLNEMFNLEQLSKIRFGMSEVPKHGGHRGDYEEKWSQWFLERSFFRDFVYRNPRGKRKGEELADAVTLFGDVAIMTQVKAQHGRRDPLLWAEEKLKEAFRQLKKTHNDLYQGRI